MKLLSLNSLRYGLSAVLLSTTLNVFADAKTPMIEQQQLKTAADIEAADKAKPMVEMRPAVTTQKTLVSPDTVGNVPDPKKAMIKHQQKTTQDEMNAAASAKPAKEMRPAVTTKKTLKAPDDAAQTPAVEPKKAY